MVTLPNLPTSLLSRLKGSTVLITGGTGSFGKRAAKHLLSFGANVRIFSRDELKQSKMRVELPDCAYFLGDVRDRSSLDQAMVSVDYVLHAAALKQVPVLEEFPLEAVKTNVLGTLNVLEKAAEHGVECVVALSSDKASCPINAYGASKMLLEKLALSAYEGGGTSVRVTRYGNVLGSRGSVVPIFQEQLTHGDTLTLTHPAMTRFLMTLDDAVELALRALNDGIGSCTHSSIWVKKAPACTVEVLAEACAAHYASGRDVVCKLIGIRPGEKMHETLVGAHEMPFAREEGGCYVIGTARAHAGSSTTVYHPYTSDGTERLGVEEVVGLLKKAEEEGQ